MDWIELAQRFGFPVVMVIILIVAISRTAKWLATNVVEPVMKAHLAFLVELQGCLREISGLLKMNVQISQAITDDLQVQTALLKEIHAEVSSGTICRASSVSPSRHPPS
jgi:uncharacterized membrane protein